MGRRCRGREPVEDICIDIRGLAIVGGIGNRQVDVIVQLQQRFKRVVAPGDEQRPRLQFDRKICESDVVQRKRVIFCLDGCANAPSCELRQVKDIAVPVSGSQTNGLVDALAAGSAQNDAGFRCLPEILNFEIRFIAQRRRWY
jgi:hypothetical protein